MKGVILRMKKPGPYMNQTSAPLTPAFLKNGKIQGVGLNGFIPTSLSI
jgi:hypothetical protein